MTLCWVYTAVGPHRRSPPYKIHAARAGLGTHIRFGLYSRRSCPTRLVYIFISCDVWPNLLKKLIATGRQSQLSLQATDKVKGDPWRQRSRSQIPVTRPFFCQSSCHRPLWRSRSQIPVTRPFFCQCTATGLSDFQPILGKMLARHGLGLNGGFSCR